MELVCRVTAPRLTRPAGLRECFFTLADKPTSATLYYLGPCLRFEIRRRLGKSKFNLLCTLMKAPATQLTNSLRPQRTLR